MIKIQLNIHLFITRIHCLLLSKDFVQLLVNFKISGVIIFSEDENMLTFKNVPFSLLV